MTEDTAFTIEEAWREQFVPVLKAAGFSGSGRNFRRVAGAFVEAVSLQSAQGGGRFAVNLGIQPIAIPDVRGNEVAANSLTERDCEFRRRMTDGGHDQWWAYRSPSEMLAASAKAARVFETRAIPMFAQMCGPNSPLLVIDPVSFDSGNFDFLGFSSTKVRMARALSLLRKAVGETQASRAFAEIGLASLGNASGLRTELVALAS